MIRRVADFALDNRLLVLAFAMILFTGSIVALRDLHIEVYPHVVHLRSFSLFGLSDLKLIFDDESDNDWNRERVLERLSQVTLPTGVVPQMGTDWRPVGQIYFFTLQSSNPKYDVMELKSLEDWVIEKNV